MKKDHKSKNVTEAQRQRMLEARRLINRLVEIGLQRKKLDRLDFESLSALAEAKAEELAAIEAVKLERQREIDHARAVEARRQKAERDRLDREAFFHRNWKPLPQVAPNVALLRDQLPGFGRLIRIWELRERFQRARVAFSKHGRVNGSVYAHDANSALRELRQLEAVI